MSAPSQGHALARAASRSPAEFGEPGIIVFRPVGTVRVTAALAAARSGAPAVNFVGHRRARLPGRGPPSDIRSLLRYPGVQIFCAPATPQLRGILPISPRPAPSTPAVFTEAIVPARCGPRQMSLPHAGPGNRHPPDRRLTRDFGRV